MYEDIVDACKLLLSTYSEAESCINYLSNRLTSDSIDKYSFGYFPDQGNINSLLAHVSEQSLLDMKLLFPRMVEDSICPRKVYFSYFANYPLIMPYRDHYGNIIALVGRTLMSDNDREKLKIAKYKNTVFKKGNYLFGLYEAKQSIIDNDSVYIVEGQFDVIKARENNITNIVAVGGSNISSYQISLIARYTKNVYLLFDNDDAGRKGREIAKEKFGKFIDFMNLYIPPPYKDIDEYLKNKESDKVEFLIQ